MNISSTPFIRNDYWPDYNDINQLNQRINEAENETALVNARLTNDIENVSANLNSYMDNQADTVITNNIIVNSLNANYAIGRYANFANTNTDNAYVENLTVNKPVFDLTLNTPHIENATSLGGNFYNANLINPSFEEIGSMNLNTLNVNTANIKELFINTQPEPITSSAVLGYDSEGRVIPIHAAYDVGFPEDANYLFTDHAGTAFAGTAATEVGISSNLITAHAVKNAIDSVTADVNDSFNIINNALNDVDSWMNNIENDVNNRFGDVANNFNDVANNFNNVNNSFNNVNNTANNLLDNVDYLKTALAPLLSLPVANVSGWINSTSPVNIQGITSFVVAPFAAPVATGSDVGDGAKLSVSGTTATLALPGLQWTMESMNGTFMDCTVFNQNVQIPDGVTTLDGTFTGCYAFNQNIRIPNSVTTLKGPFAACLVFNQNIQIPNSVTDMTQAFGGVGFDPDFDQVSCPNFNQNILIPNSVIKLGSCFYDCRNLNQNILIPNSATVINSIFQFCNNLNQPDMYIYSQNITGMRHAFNGCHINNIHIPTSVPKSTSNFMYNCLVNGNTGITFPAANIFNDLPVDIKHWPPFYYKSVPSYWDEDNKYHVTSDLDENFDIVETWNTNSGVPATNGYYLSVAYDSPNSHYYVRLLRENFNATGVSENVLGEVTLYKQDYTNIDSLYIANGQSYEPLLLGQNVILNTNPVNTGCIYRSVMYNN